MNTPKNASNSKASRHHNSDDTNNDSSCLLDKRNASSISSPKEEVVVSSAKQDEQHSSPPSRPTCTHGGDGEVTREQEEEQTLPKHQSRRTARRRHKHNHRNQQQQQEQQQENQVVHWLRWVLVVVLVTSTVTVAVAVYYHQANDEEDKFEAQWASDSNKLLTEIGTNFVSTMSAADGFMFRVMSHVRSTQATWPFLVLPDLAVQSAKLMSETNSIYMTFYPLITKEERPAWENFTLHNDAWVDEALRVQSRNPHIQSPIVTNFSRSHVIWNNENLEPTDAGGPFMPSWMGSPVIPNYYPYNWNAMAYDAFAKGLLHCMNTQSVVVTAVANHADPQDPAAVAQAQTTSDWARPYLAADEDPHEPFSDMYYPVLNAIDDVVIDVTQNNTQSMGIVAFSFYWRHILKNILPPHSTGLVLVFENPCGEQHFTYRVDGSTPTFLGVGDLHDSSLEHHAQSLSLVNLTRMDNSYTGLPMNPDFCPFTLTAYPSKDMYDQYITTGPLWVSLGAASIFVFVAALFWAYDLLVRREANAKQQLLEAKRHFMRFVSHEVRTPLNAVYLGLSLLQDEMNQVILDTNRDKIARKESKETAMEVNGRLSPTELQQQDVVVDLCSAAHLESWLHLTREICDSAESSVEVLNDLLNYDRVQMGSFSMEFEILSVWQLVSETSREFQLSARRKNIQFALENQLLPVSADATKPSDLVQDLENVGVGLDSLKIVGDRIRLTQVLRNLVSNSLKFTAEEGHLTIRASCTPIEKPDVKKLDKYTLKSGENVALKRQGTVLIQVIDTGVGMSETQLRSLFQEPWTQFNASENQAGKGSGLGLFISQGMAMQHRGELKASSSGLGRGSTFTLHLPLYNIPDKDSAPKVARKVFIPQPLPSLSTQQNSLAPGVYIAPPQQSAQRNANVSNSPSTGHQALHILVVDDVASNRKLISRMAQKRNHRVDEAKDGREAVDKVKAAMAEADPYDTILMDYEMPVLKGPDAVLEIREMGCSSFILGVTGNVLEEDLSHFTSCGANCVLPKPVKFQKLEDLWLEHGVLGDCDPLVRFRYDKSPSFSPGDKGSLEMTLPPCRDAGKEARDNDDSPCHSSANTNENLN